MSDVPASVKPIAGKYVARALQMDAFAAKKPESDAGRVAFYCRQKALTEVMKKRSEVNLSDPEVASFLGDLMKSAEAAKTSLGIKSEHADADREIVKRFALNLFSAAENDVKTGAAQEMTARRYLNAATLLEVMDDIRPLEQQLTDICKYAKYMVSEVATAVREGRAPMPPAGPNAAAETNPVGAPDSFSTPAPPPSMPPAPAPAVSAPGYPGSAPMPPPSFAAAPGYPFAHDPAAGPPHTYGYMGQDGPPQPMPHPPAAPSASSASAPMHNPAAMAAAAASGVAASPVAEGGFSPEDLTEYAPVSGACWSKQVILATKECSTAVTLLRSDDIYGATQHLEAALAHVKEKIAEHEKSGGAAKRL